MLGAIATAVVMSASIMSAESCAGPAHPSQSATLGDILTDLGLSSPPWKEMEVIKSLRREGRRHVFWTVLAKSESRAIRLEISSNIGPAAAQRLTDERSVRIRALFKPATTDYFGVVQGRTETPAELLPKVLYPGRTLLRSGDPVFILWADKDLHYAVKTRAAAVRRGLLAFRYCEKEKVFLEIATFESAARFSEEAALAELSALRCDNPR